MSLNIDSLPDRLAQLQQELGKDSIKVSVQIAAPLTVIALRGVPGSGKTTWAFDFMGHSPMFQRISRDDIREMLGEPFSSANEQVVLHLRNALAGSLLSLGYSVIVDDTNLTPWHLTSLRSLAEGYHALFQVVTMPTSLEQCIINDAVRSERYTARGAVGEGRITLMWEQLQQTLAQEKEVGIKDG